MDTEDGIINGVVNYQSDMKKLSKEEIHEIHQKNQAWKLHEELDSPQAYLNKVTKDIPLNDLYEVLDYIYVGKD